MPPKVGSGPGIYIREKILETSSLMVIKAEVNALSIGADIAAGTAIDGDVVNELRPEVESRQEVIVAIKTDAMMPGAVAAVSLPRGFQDDILCCAEKSIQI